MKQLCTYFFELEVSDFNKLIFSSLKAFTLWVFRRFFTPVIAGLFILILLLLSACVRSIEPEQLGFQDLMVVDGLLTDQMIHQQVKLSRTVSIEASSDSLRPVSGARVWIEDQDGTAYLFLESDPGSYLSENPFNGIVGNQYTLYFETADEALYQSEAVTLLATPRIDSLYATFLPEPTSNNANDGVFNFYVDSKSNTNGAKYFRWTWNSTFELSVATPSRWLWTGGNTFVNRDLGNDNNLQVELCWKTENAATVIVEDLLVPEAGVDRFQVTSFHSDTRKMYRGYSLEVKQYVLSEGAFNYWRQIATTTQGQGNFSDAQVGTVMGNVTSLSDPDEIVLGYFGASQEVSVRRYFEPVDFAEEGYRRRTIDFVDCSDLEPITSNDTQIGEVMNEIGDSYAIAFFITGGTVVYYPKRCSECTQYGDNQRPEFWRE